MKKTLAAVLVGALLLIPTFATSATAFTPAKRARFCRYESWNRQPGFTRHEVELTILCATHKWPVEGGFPKAASIADRESGFYCKAKNPYSSATGIFQVVDGTWASWYRTFSGDMGRFHIQYNRLLCRANILISVRAAHRWGWGPWGG